MKTEQIPEPCSGGCKPRFCGLLPSKYGLKTTVPDQAIFIYLIRIIV